jgi:MGT family glycosyltransferase
LTPFPASFRNPEDPLLGEVIGYHVPAPPRRERDAPAVFVTLGTIFNTESGDLLRTAALGAANCPTVRRVVVATGEHVEPASLGPLPQQVEVHQFVQQDTVLAECHAVVSHAGSGTVLGALKQALPSVALPMGADQLLNAARLDTLGLGVTLPADTADVGQVRDAVAGVLASPSMRRRLMAIRTEIQSTLKAGEAVDAVVALAR